MEGIRERFAFLERVIQDNSSPGIRPGLDRISSLLTSLGNPEKVFPVIHVVGTNGKGSTSAYVSSILRIAGYRVATYTSPHLDHLGERLTIDGESLDVEEWSAAISKIAEILSGIPLSERPTFFEILTVAAFMLIARHAVDVAVIEAGMGGRLDATNLVSDVVLSIITPIAMDHSDFLGKTLLQIAGEKFGVIRHGGKALYAGGNVALEDAFMDICSTRNASGVLFKNFYQCNNIVSTLDGSVYDLKGPDLSFSSLKTSLIGLYQINNSALAVLAANILKIRFPLVGEHAIREGLIRTKWPGRLELVSSDPYVFLDGAHNPHGIQALVETIRILNGEHSKVAIIFTSMKDKDYRKSLQLLSDICPRLYCTSIPEMSRCEKASRLAEVANAWNWDGVSSYYDDPEAALRRAIADGNIYIVCCGSLYLVGYLKHRKFNFGNL